jgi:NAD+ synthase
MKVLNQKQCKKFVDLAIGRLAEYIRDAGIKGVTLGISGGIDSAVMGVIGLKTCEKLKSEGYDCGYKYIFLDCESDPGDYERAKELAKKFKFELNHMDLTDWFKASPLIEEIPKGHPRERFALGNIKCRLRMISLYHFDQIHGFIYLDTDDLSEELMGFWTLHGDVGRVKVMQHITKSEVYDVAEYLGVPEVILKNRPGDGLGVTAGNQAVDILQLDYIYIEYLMSRFISAGFDPNGFFDQLEEERFQKLAQKVAKEIDKPLEKVTHVLEHCLGTAFKRRYGDNVCHLLPDRKEFGFPEFGTKEFDKVYLKAIRSLK